MACRDLQGKEYCYARRMYRRFKWDPEIRFDGRTLKDLSRLKPSKIFVGSTMELFGNWVKFAWVYTILDWVGHFPQHTFIFLTKKPENLAKWSPFPPNVWVGVSATDRAMWFDATWELQDIKAPVKFISFEPLLSWSHSEKEPLDYTSYFSDWNRRAGINWLILGSRTQPVKHPPREWVVEIISAADKAGVPVFVKEPMASHFGINRKEIPVDKVGRNL